MKGLFKDQNQTNLFALNLLQTINPNEELLVLAGQIDWNYFDKEFLPFYSTTGRPAAAFQWKGPCDPSDLVRFQDRIGPDGFEKILKYTTQMHGSAWDLKKYMKKLCKAFSLAFFSDLRRIADHLKRDFLALERLI